jgi:hypothetical protein
MSKVNPFEVAGEVSFAELEDRLRRVTLLGQPDILPYAYAEISIEPFTWDTVLPTSKYVLTDCLATQAAIEEVLDPLGHHPLELEKGLVIASPNGTHQVLTPPIVEQFDGDGPQPYILDGSHRTNRGRWAGREGFLGLFIRGIHSDCPAYALPNPWEEVTEMEKLPQGDLSLLKNYRNYEDRYKLYRDLGPINGSLPRRPEDQ